MLYLHNTGVYARYIARELQITSVFPREGIVSRRRNKLARHINWGCGRLTAQRHEFPESTLNYDISRAVSKVKTFDALNAVDIAHPTYSRDHTAFADAKRYLGRKDYGTGGEGIVVYEQGQQPADRHDFYTLFIPKSKEFRIHVFLDHVICEQMKYIPNGSGVLIRNHANGARFHSKSLDVDLGARANEARELAIRAVAAVGIDFGAVDMILGRDDIIYILEVNTAPGLSGEDNNEDRLMPRTYAAYRDAIRQLVIER